MLIITETSEPKSRDLLSSRLTYDRKSCKSMMVILIEDESVALLSHMGGHKLVMETVALERRKMYKYDTVSWK